MFDSDERINYALAFIKYDNKKLNLDPWQQEYIGSKARYICILKSRRIGYSLATGLKGIVKSNDPGRINYTKQFVSYNESDALEKIRYAEIFHDSMPSKVKKKLVVRNKASLEFRDIGSKTTSRLISLPCRPPRGKGGDIALDEFGIYLPRLSQTIYTAALSVIARGGCFEVGSTPLGKIGQFYEICTNKEKFTGYQRYYIPWWFCSALCNDMEAALKLAPDMPTEERVYRFGSKELISIFENESLESFQQEHECLFVDGAQSYITLDLILANTPGQREEDTERLAMIEAMPDITSGEYANECFGIDLKVYHSADDLILNYNPEIHGAPLYMGYDVAKNQDAVSFIILGIMPNGKKRMIMRVEEHNKDFEWQKNTFRKIMDNLPIYRAEIDCTGMGAPIYEELNKQYGDKVEGYQFTLESKEPLAMGVKFSLEQREFELENDKGFHNQIHSIKRSPALGRHFRYDADRNEGVHADSFWSLALANYATMSSAKVESFYSQYARKKNELNVSTQQVNNSTNNNIMTRGKSVQSILKNLKKLH